MTSEFLFIDATSFIKSISFKHMLVQVKFIFYFHDKQKRKKMSETIQKGHPKGLYLLFFTEMWERFSYYGMRAIFTLFMVNALVMDKSLASTVYGNYTGLVYLTPLIGGYVADRYWGNRRSIFWGGVMMAIGQFFMFLAGSFYTEVGLATTLMFAGLGFLIFGNGFFKPNISTMVGQLYPEGDKRVDAAFTIFYMGINLGAFIAPLVCGTLGEVYDKEGLIVPAAFKWGFLAACIGMIISIISFELFKNKYIVSPTGEAVGAVPLKVEVKEDVPKKKMNIAQILNWTLISLVLFVSFKGLLGFDNRFIHLHGLYHCACIHYHRQKLDIHRKATNLGYFHHRIFRYFLLVCLRASRCLVDVFCTRTDRPQLFGNGSSCFVFPKHQRGSDCDFRTVICFFMDLSWKIKPRTLIASKASAWLVPSGCWLPHHCIGGKRLGSIG